MDISWVYQRDPVEITVRPVEENRPDIQQYRIDLGHPGTEAAHHGGSAENGGYERVIAFCNTKNMTDRLAALAPDARLHLCPYIHGDIPQKNREKTLKGFPGR